MTRVAMPCGTVIARERSRQTRSNLHASMKAFSMNLKKMAASDCLGGNYRLKIRNTG
jgi:hypothetical protein